jgi:hypothetical protein
MVVAVTGQPKEILYEPTLRSRLDGIDVGPDGATEEENHVDYDNLTWSQRVQPPHRSHREMCA